MFDKEFIGLTLIINADLVDMQCLPSLVRNYVHYPILIPFMSIDNRISFFLFHPHDLVASDTLHVGVRRENNDSKIAYSLRTGAAALVALPNMHLAKGVALGTHEGRFNKPPLQTPKILTFSNDA